MAHVIPAARATVVGFHEMDIGKKIATMFSKSNLGSVSSLPRIKSKIDGVRDTLKNGIKVSVEKWATSSLGEILSKAFKTTFKSAGKLLSRIMPFFDIG